MSKIYTLRYGAATDGWKPGDLGFVNRSPAAANPMQRIADALVIMATRRLKVHMGWWTWQSNVTADDYTARCRIFVSPLISKLRFTIVLTAVRYTAAAQPNPFFRFELKNLLTGETTFTDVSGDLYHGHRDPTNIGPINFSWFPLTYTLPGGAGGTYEFRLYQSDLIQVVGLTVDEVPPSAVDVEATYGLAALQPPDTGAFVLRRGVYDADLAEVWQLLRSIKESQGSVYFAWSQMDPSGTSGGEGPASITTSLASLVNIFDTSVTGWSTNERGFWTYPENHGTFESNDVWVVIWAIVEWSATPPTGAQQISFAQSGATIGTMDIQPYDPGSSADSGAIALNCNWASAAAQTVLKIDVLAKNADASQSYKIRACGMYAKVPLDPRSISGLSVWLAADKITGLTDGNSVTTWSDKSGNAFDAGQATAANKPTYKTGIISGKAVVRFDGVDDYMTVADASGYKTTNVTAFVVARRNAPPSFPSIDTSAATNTASGTSHVITLPSSLYIGKLLVAVFVAANNTTTITWPSGWTSVVADGTSGTCKQSTRYRIVDGSEGSTITLTTSVTTTCSAHVVQVKNHSASTSAPEAGYANGSSTNANPPNLTPTGGAKNYLWIATAAPLSVDVTADPSSYTALLDTSGVTPRLRSAYRTLNASSENPGTFTNATGSWIATTIAIHPGTEGAEDQGLVGYPHAGSSSGWRWGLTVSHTSNGTMKTHANNASNSFASAYPTVPRVWTYDTAAAQVWRDGTSKIDSADPGSITYPTAVGLYVGASADLASTAFWAGDIAEILIYGRQLTATERGHVELYLSEKYGLIRGKDWNL